MKKWASTTVALGLGLAASLASTSATMVQFKHTMMAMESNRIQFNEYEVTPQSQLLLSASAMSADMIPCTTTQTSVRNSGNATIMIAISKCLNSTALDLIQAWVESTKTARATYVDDDGVTKTLTFATTLIPDDCEQRTERAYRGYNDTSGYSSQTLLSDGTDYTMYSEVLPQEVERIQAFARFGRVLSAAPTEVPIAVVSFVNNERSYDYVEQYESKYKITNSFNFQLCQSGTACGGTFENCIQLQENIDLFMYNPFQVVRSTECSALVGGIPVTYLDAAGKHQCYCKCPPGEEIQRLTGQPATCVAPPSETCDCVWQKPSEHFHIDNTKNLDQCLFTNLSSCWHVPVPFPLDNYVSDFRNNSADGTNNLASGPHVDVIVTRFNGTVFSADDFSNYQSLVIDTIEQTTKATLIQYLQTINPTATAPTSVDYTSSSGPASAIYEWKDYQKNRDAKIDSIEFRSYGKFKLELTATDYSDSATCLGCMEVVDKFRPKNTTQCPIRVCDNSTSLCSTSKAGIVEVANTPQFGQLQGLVDAVYTYRDNAANDACGSPRCDANTYSVKSWLESDYTPSASFDSGRTCLSQDVLESTFLSSGANANPLKTSAGAAKTTDSPVGAFVCRRCCKYGVELKEWWVDYKCGYDYDIKKCAGDAPKCDFEQCAALNGDSLATATANIKSSVKTESDSVLASLGVEGFQSYTQIHRALPCTDFDESDSRCSYSASVADLFDKGATLKFTNANANQYVYWRYKVGSSSWQLWESDSLAAHTFNKAATPIHIEAWTACGRVRQFFFYVHLHTHSDIKVCDYFKGMWYQSTVTHMNASETAELCAYPGSDFAEITFDYQANIGLKYAYDRLRMNVTGVTCDLQFTGKAAAQILNSTGTSKDVIERYAVELQNLARTSPLTSFTTSCTFTYRQYGGSVYTQTCQRAFVIKDCDAPTIDTPGGECSWDRCAGQGQPGPYEVCSGNVVGSTATATFLNTTDAECCQGCSSATECTSILNLPVGKDIKRCVPPTTTEEGYGYGYDSYESTTYTADTYISSSLLAKAAANHPTAAAATVLLVASALVALVALVVVRQRRAANAPIEIVDDAYYPLLH